METLAKWSVDDYHRMVEADILRDRRVELLAGDIVEMSPETPSHYNTAKRGASYLAQMLDGGADVRFNGPITLTNSEPEPDITIVRLPESAYDNRHPGPDDIFWIVEVSKTSLKKDLDTRAVIYVNAKLPEYWVLDLFTKQLIVMRDPQNGRYTMKQTVTEGTVSSLAFPTIQISVERLFA